MANHDPPNARRQQCLRPKPARAILAAALLVVAGCWANRLDWQRAEAQDPAPSGPRYLRLYKESHFQALGDEFQRGMAMDELCTRAARARVLFLGDHHADQALHERMLALLAEFDRRDLPYALGLECIGTQDEVAVAAFLAGRLTLDDLLRTARARWPENWFERDGVDRAFYRSLLTRARACRREVFALEPTPRLPLYERDQAMAKTIRERARARPNTLLVIVVGETHLLGQGQLVRRVDLPSVAVGARLSVALRDRAPRPDFAPQDRFAETSNMLFFLPLTDAAGPD